MLSLPNCISETDSKEHCRVHTFPPIQKESSQKFGKENKISIEDSTIREISLHLDAG
jgi:hypothetical protein